MAEDGDGDFFFDADEFAFDVDAREPVPGDGTEGPAGQEAAEPVAEGGMAAEQGMAATCTTASSAAVQAGVRDAAVGGGAAASNTGQREPNALHRLVWSSSGPKPYSLQPSIFQPGADVLCATPPPPNTHTHAVRTGLLARLHVHSVCMII